MHNILSEQLDAQTSEAEKLPGAAKQIRNRASEVKRLAGMKEHYKTTKVVNLIKSNFGSEFANVIAEKIHAGVFGQAASAIDPKEVQFFAGATGTVSIPENLQAYQAQVSANLPEKAVLFVEELLNHNKKRTMPNSTTSAWLVLRAGLDRRAMASTPTWVVAHGPSA